MSQRERAFRRPREGDLEKRLRPEYKEYEEWRASQGSAAPVEVTEQKKPQAKKAFLGKWDLLFIILGVLAGLIYQSCKATP